MSYLCTKLSTCNRGDKHKISRETYGENEGIWKIGKLNDTELWNGNDQRYAAAVIHIYAAAVIHSYATGVMHSYEAGLIHSYAAGMIHSSAAGLIHS